MSTVALPYQLTKTLVGALAEMQAISNVDRLVLANTTLNHKYNVFPSELPEASPTLAYFGIGVRGYKNIDDSNGAAPFIPSSKDLDLYTPLPFRVVPVAEDLSVAERTSYRMRVLQTVGGEQYWCYYLKKLSFVDNRVKIIKTDLTTGVETVLSELDETNLTPTPTSTSVEGVTTSNEKISVALTASVQITGAEVIEAINVLYGGNLLKAIVSEIGLYLGNDQSVNLNDGVGGTFVGKEAIFTTLAYHYTSLGIPFQNANRIEQIGIRLNSASSFLV